MTLALLPSRDVRPDLEPARVPCARAPLQPVIADRLAALRTAWQHVEGGVCVALSGLDGSGKSTLARELARVLQSVGIPATIQHRFRWHTNLLRTPRMIRRHRRRGCGVCILDRTLEDNVAGVLARSPILAPVALGLARAAAPDQRAIDLRLRLAATWEQTAARRPELTRACFDRFEAAYRTLEQTCGLFQVPSSENVLNEVVDRLIQVLAARRVTRRVILHADDLGLLHAFNEGIRRAHHEGLLTSTSLRANGLAYRQAIEDILPDCPRLGVGLHLCLNEAGPVTPRSAVPLLLDRRGNLRSGFGWLLRTSLTSPGRAQIERELRAQIEKVLADSVPIAHLDSHQHVHMIPAIFRIVCRLACEYGVNAVRISREPLHFAGPGLRRFMPLLNGNALKHLLLNCFAARNRRTAAAFGLRFPDAFVGVLHTGGMTLDTVRAGLQAARRGVVEVLLHPTIGPDPRDRAYPAEYLRDYVAAPQRKTELAALCAPALRDRLRAGRWKPADYASALAARRSPQPPARTPHIPAEIREICTRTPAECPPWVSMAQADARAFAEIVLTQATPNQRVLDLGTGSGILAICLARRGVDVVASDVSAGAVRTAQRNAQQNRVEFACFTSDLLAAVPGRFDFIAFNVPYGFRPDNWLTSVAKHVARRVPFVCRNSGTVIPNGVLRFHRDLFARLLDQAPAHLRLGGALLLHLFDFEVGMVASMLSSDARLEVLHHPEFRAHRTVALAVEFSQNSSSRREKMNLAPSFSARSLNEAQQKAP